MNFLPTFLQPYARLMRLDKPTGYWLLLFPAWWSAALATPHGQGPDFFLMFLFFCGAVIMRGAGCTINDILDRKIDAQVARTKTRPVASGEIPVPAALLFGALLTLVGLALVIQMGRLPLILAVASLPLILIYPLMKRFTWWPQAFLGLTFNWGALMGAAAVTQTISLPALVLYVAGFFWTLGYDTIYAFQDVKDDPKAGVRSTARLLAKRPRSWVGFFYFIFWLLLLAAGRMASMGFGFYAGMAVVLFAIATILRLWRTDSMESSFGMFRANTWLGWIVLASLIAGLFSTPL